MSMKNGLVGMSNNALTMSSLEIAELTGKRHDNVMADIRNLLIDLNLDAPDFSGAQKYNNNNTRRIFNLPRRECDLLLMGYSIVMRAKVYDRWLELETKPVTPYDTFLEWDKTRQLGKAHRLSSTDAMRALVGKMVSEGHPLNPPALFAILTDNTNKILFIQKGKADNWRQCMNKKQLDFVRMADNIIADIINDSGLDDTSEDIIIAINKRLHSLVDAVGRTALMDNEYINRLVMRKARKLQRLDKIKQLVGQGDMFDK